MTVPQARPIMTGRENTCFDNRFGVHTDMAGSPKDPSVARIIDKLSQHQLTVYQISRIPKAYQVNFAACFRHRLRTCEIWFPLLRKRRHRFHQVV